MIELSGISVQFGGVVAIDALTARLGAPICGVIGPNGAGKTTLLNVLSGFVIPSEGSVTIEGARLLEMQPHKRARWGLRRTFQTEQIVEDLTVEDNIRVMLDSRPLSKLERDQDLAGSLDHTGLTDRRSVDGAELTTVERKLTEIARGLAGSPKVLLLDEPGGGLSGAETERLRSVIRTIPDRYGAQVVLIDHDVELIRAVCETTLVLDFGRKIAEGPTADVLESNVVKAAYLGEEVAP